MHVDVENPYNHYNYPLLMMSHVFCIDSIKKLYNICVVNEREKERDVKGNTIETNRLNKLFETHHITTKQ